MSPVRHREVEAAQLRQEQRSSCAPMPPQRACDDGIAVDMLRPRLDGKRGGQAPGVAHEWLAWRRGLHEFASLLLPELTGR